MNLIFQIITWNVGSSDPPNEEMLVELLQLNSKVVDVYAIFLQEIETGLVETAKSFLSYDDWTKSFLKVFSKSKYYMVRNIRVQGITLSVFSLIKHLPYIRYIKADIERTGALASTWGNKGGVAISVSLYSHSICFLNTHLAAHLTFDADRIDDFKEVIDEMDFDGTTTIMNHEIVFWAGDLNFRLEEIDRDEVVKISLNETSFEKLLQYDQLKKHMQQKCIFAHFVEGPISFPPTYKFNPGSDIYDSSEKKRKPAYTDRILHRINPDKSFVHDMVKMQLNTDPSSYSQQLVTQCPGSYKSLPQFKQSDHKPVTAQYTVSVGDKLSRLVELSIDEKWTDETCKVNITYYHGMVSDSKDFLALYEENIGDPLSYKVSKYLDETFDRDVSTTFRRSCKFSTDTKEKGSKHRIGYFSHRMSCLLAVTEPFTIQC